MADTHTHTVGQALQRGTVGELIERINHLAYCIDRLNNTVASLRATQLTAQQQQYVAELEREAQQLLTEHQRIQIEFSFKQTTQKPTDQTTILNIKSIADTHVLLVEDDLIIRTVALNILKRSGAEITVAINGKEATVLTTTNKYDIILMDIQMPVMDGFEAARVIRYGQKCSTPIVGLTASAVKNMEELYYDAGMNDVISKPYNQEKLVGIIHKWTTKEKINNIEPVTETEAKIETSDSSLFCLEKLRDIGNPEFVNRMLRLFVDQVSPAVAVIRKAYDEKDFATVQNITHRIRPSILNMGIDSIKTEIFEIEELAKANESNSTLNDMITKLEDVMAQVTAEIRKLLTQ